MDQTGIDRLIEVLEKAQQSELQKFDSPPVVVNGRRGIWRMVRGFRTFIEVGDGYKPQAGVVPNGRVLFGPPSLKGKNSGDIDSDTWAALTPKETNKKFSEVDVAGNGLQNLKDQVKETLGPDDTRRPNIDKAHSVEELVPMARSAGFLDDEIATALKGEKVVPGEVHDFPGGKSRLRGTTKPDSPKALSSKPEGDEEPELAATGTDAPAALRPRPTRETKPKGSKSSSEDSGSPIQGALALALGSDSAGQDADEAKRQDAASGLRQAAARARKEGETQLAGWYEELANLIIPAREDQNRQALERVARQILDYHKKHTDKPEAAVEEKPVEAPAAPEADAPAADAPAADAPAAAEQEMADAPKTDKELVQDAIDNANTRVENDYEKFVDEAKGDIERAKELALAEILEAMEAAAKNPQVKMQLRRAKNDLRANKRNRRYTMMRLLRILRILMALIPG